MTFRERARRWFEKRCEATGKPHTLINEDDPSGTGSWYTICIDCGRRWD